MEQKVSLNSFNQSGSLLDIGFPKRVFSPQCEIEGVNLLLHYDEGCLGRCDFCGLSKSRQESPRGKRSSGWTGLSTRWKKSSKGQKAKTKFIASASR